MTTETTTDGITIHYVSGTELHHQYPGQSDPQDCYVYLDCKTGDLGADWNGEIGNAVPMNVWHGHVQRWGIPALREDAANELLDAIAPLAARVVDGYSSEWDGNNNVARFDEDAQEADEAITALCERTMGDADKGLRVWIAQEWLEGVASTDLRCAEEIGITADTTDDELREIGSGLELEARAEDVDVLEGLDEYLEELRETCRKAEIEKGKEAGEALADRESDAWIDTHEGEDLPAEPPLPWSLDGLGLETETARQAAIKAATEAWQRWA